MATGNAVLKVQVDVQPAPDLLHTIGLLDAWAERWRVEDAEGLLSKLRAKAGELHELVYATGRAKTLEGNADRLLAELEELIATLEAYLPGGAS